MKEEEEKEGKKTIDIGKEAAIEAEVRAARERAIVPLETRIKSFRDMLAEKDVSYCNIVILYHFFYVRYIVSCHEIIIFSGVCIQYLGKRTPQNCVRPALLTPDVEGKETGFREVCERESRRGEARKKE